MKNRVIKSDLTSRLSYTITDDSNGILKVIKNTNQVEKEEYEGICPEGNYIVLTDIAGFPPYVLDASFQLKVDSTGKFDKLDIPTIK
jgi:hypothetical protein